MSSPFFSVIIPTFNSGHTISRCLDRLLHQTFQDFELVIIDGGSHDRTVDQVKSAVHGKREITLVSENDQGIYDAMNKGLKMAKGNWLFFLGSDDYLHDNSVLADVKNAIDRNSDSKFVYGNVLTSWGRVQKFDHFSFERLIEKNICHQAIFYHASLFNASCYDSGLRLLADWDFNLKVFRKRNHPCYINRVITVYNMEGASANWIEGHEYYKNFRNKRNLYIRHRGFASYLQYLFKSWMNNIKKSIRTVFPITPPS